MTAVIEDTATAAATETAETAEREPVDYSAFEAAVAGIDVDTASDEDSDAIKAARQAYTDLNGPSKRAAKKWLKSASEEAVLGNDFAEAKRLIHLNSNAARNVGGTKSPSVSRKSPATRAVENFKTIHLAYQLAGKRLVDLGIDPAESTPDTDVTPAHAYVDYIENGTEDTPEPDIDNMLKRAARVSLGRGPGGQGRKPGAKNKAAEKLADAVAE